MSDDTFHLDDLKDIAKRLPPNVLARFEPVTGLVVVNMTRDSYLAGMRRFVNQEMTESDLTLVRTLNHETCHFTQCVSSGYMGYRNRVLWRALKSWRNRLTALRLFWLSLQSLLRVPLLRLLYRKATDGQARALQMAQFMHENNRSILINKVTNGRPQCAARLNLAHFFHKLDALRESELEKGPEGVSTLGILEGAAVAYCAAMEPDNQEPAAFAKRMEEDLRNLPELYGELWGALNARAPERAFDLILPLAALALAYERPHMAIGPMLERLLESIPGQEKAAARKLFENVPRVKAAGRALKSPQHHRHSRRRARLYDTYIDVLRKDPASLDDFGLLTDALYLNRVEAYPVSSTFADGYSMAALMENEELAMRVLIASQTLEVESRGRDVRDSKRYMVNYFQSVFSRIFGPPDE